jgi:hypothetical protein
MNPKLRRRAAIAMVIITLIGWPVSAFTWAANEPQFVLGLSWLAITLTCLDIAATTDVRAEQDDKGE